MIKESRRKHHLLKWIGGLIFFTGILTGATIWYVSIKLRPVISTELKALVLNTTDSLYHLEFSNVRTNIITGNATLVNVQLIPDTAVLKKLILLKKAPNNVYTIRLKRLMIRGFHPRRLFQDKKLNIDLLLVEKPEVLMVNKQFSFNEEKSPGPVKSPFQYISPYLKQLYVRSIVFQDVKFKYVNNNFPKKEVDAVKNLNVTLTDWLIDPNSANDRSRIYLLKDIAVRIKDYTYATPDSMYHVNIDQLDFHAATGRLNITQFGLIPRYDEMQFGKIAGFEKERYNIRMNNISMYGINFPLYVLKQELFAKQMNVTDGYVAVFNNKLLPETKTGNQGKYPHQLLKALKGLVTIKKMDLKNINISYSEIGRNSQQKGIVTFENTSGSLRNVTNAPGSKDHLMAANLTTYMMGRGKLNVNFQFDLRSKDGAFSYNGILTNMNGRSLNRVTKPLGMIQIRNGYVNKLAFNIKANDHLATGRLDFAYQDLNVALLKKEEGKDHLVKQGLASFLANQLVINTDNPDRDGKFISAPIHYQRRPTGTFFSFIWQTLFQGIKYSVGFTEAKKEEISDQLAKFEKIKADRDLRRKQRQRRRERKRQ